MRDERPEDEQNPELIRELANIKYNYFLTSFKEVFNDVLEERRRIVKEQNSRLRSMEQELAASQRESSTIRRTDDLRHTTSHQMINDRFGTASKSVLGGGSITPAVGSTTGSVAALPTRSQLVLLTGSDQKQIDKMRMRNERFTSKLINDQNKQERYQNHLIKRSEKHEQNKQNREDKEYDRKDFVQVAQERREKQQSIIKARRLEEEKKWAAEHRRQKEENEKRFAKLQLVDEERINQMK